MLATQLLSANCRSTDAVIPEPPCPADLQARITPGSQLLRLGDTITLQAAVFGCGGTKPLAATWSWSVSDTTVARIDPRSGTITARRSGTSDVVARSQPFGAVALARISVQP